MFEVGWSEILVIAIVALIVFPTEDLPKLLRTAGQVVGRLRRMAGDFQAQMNTVIREAEREIENSDVKEGLSIANPLTDLKKTLDPIRSIGDDLKRSVTMAATAPTTDAAPPRPADPAHTEPTPAIEPAPVAEPVPVVAAETPVEPVAAPAEVKDKVP